MFRPKMGQQFHLQGAQFLRNRLRKGSITTETCIGLEISRSGNDGHATRALTLMYLMNV